MIHMGAESTLDSLLGDTAVEKKADELIDTIEKSDKIVEKEQKICQKKTV